MKYIYIISFFIILVFFLYKKRTVDFIVIYFLSSVIFYFNAFLGEIFIGKLNMTSVTSYPVFSLFYVVLFINLAIILLFLVMKKNKFLYIQKKPFLYEKKIMQIMIIIAVIIAIYMCIKYNFFSRVIYNKTILSENSGTLETYFKYIASFIFVYMFCCEKIQYSFIWKLLAIIPIATTFLFGNRSFLIVSLLAVIFNIINDQCKKKSMNLFRYIIHHKKIIMTIIILFFVTLVIKGVTGALFTGNFELVLKRLTDVNYYKQVFYVSEPNTISKNLDTILKNNFRLPKSSYIALWTYFIPFVTESLEKMLGATNFTLFYQQALYINDLNNASTYLGEAYANGGLIVVILIITFCILFLSFIYKLYLKCQSNISKTTLLLIGIDVSFYIQRNSLAFEFSRIRAYIYIAFLLFSIFILFDKRHKIIL